MNLTPNIYFREVPKTIDMEIRSELYSTNDFTFAVAVILSAQATDKKVNEVTPALFADAPTPEAMLMLGEEGLKRHIKVISFFNNKAKNIIALSEKLAGQIKVKNPQDWKFPKQYHNQKALMALPGIGQKTANVIMNVLWGAPSIGVDTHVFRNAHRYGWVGLEENTPEKVEAALLKLIPKKYHAMTNHVMVLHGRYICRALRPKCGECPVAKWCNAFDKII
ncbi:MAG: endonuclease III [Rickettsiales bacterium]|jgi:endonuclease-3|nr:endonuclease III [Rickettsiales bacterium]